MNEDDQKDGDLFGDLVEGLEDELNTKLLEKRATHAIASARVTGAVYTEAVAGGVPAPLAQEMATDTWMAVMGIQSPQVEAQETGGEG
ncbi:MULTISPECIES: hypothetical protein [Streptomyces]|uniref:DUF222 domain-containing protein n=2 Tax=Streptomyces TaxID=1883 RepID=A0ABV9IUJ3_9ACTN